MADDNIYFNKALISYENKNYENAVFDIKKAIELNENSPDYYQLEGMILEAQEKHQEAIQSYEKAIELIDDDEKKEQIQKKVKTLYDIIVQ